MKSLAISLLLLSPALSQAAEKASVTLDASGYSSSGGSGREKMPEVEVTRGFGSKKYDIPVKEQIAALQNHINFLTLMEKNGIDLSKEITATYADKPLSDVLKELMPKIPVKFDGVDEKETVESLKADKARLSMVIEWLDDAAGVYFVFTGDGVTVASKPPVIE